MRLIKIAAPEGRGDDITKIAFAAGIESVSRWQLESRSSDGGIERKDIVDIETSTPKAKRFIDELLAAPFFDRKDFTVSTRQPRAIVSKNDVEKLTEPYVEPSIDILQELFQFSHITLSFVGRVVIAACLIAYGMIRQETLLMIGGLLVLPLTTLLLAVSYGIRSGIWKLVRQGALAFLLATVLLALSGAGVAAISQPPLKYNDFNSLLASFLISVAVGVGAGFANIDDAGQRQLIGLAATAQIAVIPVWFGICAVFGFPGTVGRREIIEHGATFFVNTLTMIAVPFVVYTLTKAANRALKKTR